MNEKINRLLRQLEQAAIDEYLASECKVNSEWKSSLERLRVRRAAVVNAIEELEKGCKPNE